MYWSLAGGVFVGNFLFYAAQGQPQKGAAIGGIAAIIVLAFYGICQCSSEPTTIPLKRRSERGRNYINQ